MKLSQILSQIKSDFEIASNHDLLDQIDIEDIAIDSRLVKKNSAFFALIGQSKDGAEFIFDAVQNGAKLVVSSHQSKIPAEKNVIFIVSENVFLLLVEFLKIFYSPLPANIYAISPTNSTPKYPSPI